MDYKRALEEFYFYKRDGTASNFHAELYRLIEKVDSSNLARLAAAFPAEVHVVTEWRESPNEKLWFKEHGFEL